MDTCNRPSMVYKAPVISAFLFLFQIVSHYFGSSSVTRRRPCQIDAIFKGTDHFRCCWGSRVTCRANTTMTILCYVTLLSLLLPLKFTKSNSRSLHQTVVNLALNTAKPKLGSIKTYVIHRLICLLSAGNH